MKVKLIKFKNQCKSKLIQMRDSKNQVERHLKNYKMSWKIIKKEKNHLIPI